jgi:2-phosphoglycerate kinase
VKDHKVIVVSDPEPGLPYSKGLRTSDLMVTGLSPLRAYQVAEAVEDRLLSMNVDAVTRDELNDLTEEVLAELAGERYARNFRRWEEVRRLDVPVVLMIGGATGVGKSTIATRLAVQLSIVRVVATDAVREVMRATLTEQLMPTLYTSSFDADSALREPPGRTQDTVVVGFREQTAAVSVGINAMLERAATEGTSTIIEGVHAVPGFVDHTRYQDRILAIPVVVTVEDEELHRGHFAARAQDDASVRPFNRYVRSFDNIRRIQRYIKSQAMSHDVPIVPNYSLDQILSALIDLVIERATERLRDARERATTDGGGRGAAAQQGGAQQASELEEARR